VNRPYEAGLACWRTKAAGGPGDRVELHVHTCAGAPPSQDDAVQLGCASSEIVDAYQRATLS
jgi:hypothetical protein